MKKVLHRIVVCTVLVIAISVVFASAIKLPDIVVQITRSSSEISTDRRTISYVLTDNVLNCYFGIWSTNHMSQESGYSKDVAERTQRSMQQAKIGHHRLTLLEKIKVWYKLRRTLIKTNKSEGFNEQTVHTPRDSDLYSIGIYIDNKCYNVFTIYIPNLEKNRYSYLGDDTDRVGVNLAIEIMRACSLTKDINRVNNSFATKKIKEYGMELFEWIDIFEGKVTALLP